MDVSAWLLSIQKGNSSKKSRSKKSKTERLNAVLSSLLISIHFI